MRVNENGNENKSENANENKNGPAIENENENNDEIGNKNAKGNAKALSRVGRSSFSYPFSGSSSPLLSYSNLITARVDDVGHAAINQVQVVPI